MAEALFLATEAPPTKMKISLDFYNEEHKKLILAGPVKERIEKLKIPGDISIPTVEMLTYYLFYKKRAGTPGYRNYSEIAAKHANALAELDGMIDWSDGTVRMATAGPGDRGTTERLGEAIGLSVVSQIHGLTEADWAPIDETNKRKTLDYEYAASDGATLIRAETKGSVVEKNVLQVSSVSNHKTSIEKKKEDERKASGGGKSSAILYGTISVFDSQSDNLARCWILDPPISINTSPRTFRVLSRISAIADLISFLSPSSQLAVALQNRLAALKALDRIDALDKVGLLRGNGKPFSTETFDFRGRHNPWFGGKCRVVDGPAGGRIFFINMDCALFIGIREDLLTLSIDQSFQDIRAYRAEPGTVFKGLWCAVPRGQFEREFLLAPDSRIELSETGGYVYFYLEGYLHYAISGLVFGVLPFPRDKKGGIPR